MAVAGKRRAGSLATYRKKRDFKKTSEPAPKLGKGQGRQFVVQKHDARRLHFDLRLELNGVLKSWAVPHGPSLVPGVKRLAVQTEDHPMEYLEWEGVIPKGEYGGGTMIVWDRGHWTPDKDAERGLAKGQLDFRLEGSRLKGRWHLSRMARRSGEKKDSWLLIKGRDEFAREPGEPEIVDEETTSFLSGRSNADLEAQGEVRPDHKAREAIKKIKLPSLAKRRGAKKGILPVFVEPSLATRSDEPPDGEGWVHEIKYDGYRTQARLDGGKVKLLTRIGLDWTHRFGPIAAAMESLPVSAALFDGEIIAQDETGLSSFSALQTDLKAGRKDRLGYFIFDLLYVEGYDIRAMPLLERKELLQITLAGLPEKSIVKYSEHLEGDGAEIRRHACQLGMEGIVSKEALSPYHSGRGESWIKSKCVLRQEFVVIGFVPSTSMRNAIGSLVLGYYKDGKLMHAGRAGTGYSEDEAAGLRTMLETRPAAKPVFGSPLPAGAGKDVRWVKPELVAEIEYRGWSNDGMLRQSSYKGLREDKPPAEIRLEEEKRAIAAVKSRATPSAHLTHPERILWKDEGITKQGLADFYTDIAEWILPHIRGRVLSLVRCPQGAGKPCFYAKHVWQGASSSLYPVDVGESEPMMAIADLSGLLALVQASVLEIHPWGSRVETLEQPDFFILDLDPGEDVAWDEVTDAAIEVRDRLKKLKLKSFVKTTGGKGLHIVTPIVPEADWETVKEFTHQFVLKMAADSPDRYVTKMTKAIRRGRIFVDYLRNGRGATAVAPYSTRARNGAPVATPLDWSELSPAITAAHYSVTNIRQRLDYLKQDPWQNFYKVQQRLNI